MAAACGEEPVRAALSLFTPFPAGSEACERPGPGRARPVRLWGGRLCLSARRQPSWGKLTFGLGRLWPGVCPEYRRVL